MNVLNKHMVRFIRPLLFLVLVCSTAGGRLFAEELNSSRGFFLDLPEGYTFMGGDGQTSFTFSGPDGVALAELKLYSSSAYSGFSAFTAQIRSQLDSSMQLQNFMYGSMPAALGTFSSGQGGERVRGLAFMLHQQTNADGISPYYLLMLSYTSLGNYTADIDFLESAIDGFSLDASWRSHPGPVSTAALANLTPGRPKRASLRFGAATIDLDWQPEEALLAQQLVEREYRVLMPYGSAPELIQPAMQRFYRLIYRQSAISLDRLALLLSAAWEGGDWAGPVAAAPAAADGSQALAADFRPDAAGPRYGIPSNPLGYTAALLSWTQSFIYERDPTGSDVVNPISAASEQRGDCDARALLLAILLKRENINAGMMISLPHSHALAMFDMPGQGARFPWDGRSWLVGETTAPVQPGMIDQSQSAIEDWFGISFDY